MFKAIVRWFGSGAERARPARGPGGLRFVPRLECLEARETTDAAGGCVVWDLSAGDGISALGTRRAGEEVPALTGSPSSGIERGFGVGLLNRGAGSGVEL
jgi:hypothetical protein